MTTPTQTVYDVDYFIAKFSAIPEEKWCSGTYESIEGKRCAYGHCGMKRHLLERDIPEANSLKELFHKTLGESPAYINDGLVELYPQDTQKQRILAALQDIKNGNFTTE